MTLRSPSLARRLLPKLVLSTALGALFAWIVARGGVPLVPHPDTFRSVAWWSLPAFAAVLLVGHFFRASRWRFLMAPVKPIPLREAVALNWIGFFAIFALPLRLGEVVRPALTKMRQGVPISTGLGTVAVERIFDGLLTSLCVLWALMVVPMPPAEDELVRSLTYYGYLTVALFGTAFAGLLLFLWQRRLALWLVNQTLGRASPKAASFLEGKLEELASGLRAVAVPRLLAGFMVETAAYWGLNILSLWLLAIGCGIPMDLGQAVAVVGLFAIGILLPAGPGLFGNFQLALTVSLKLYFGGALVTQQGAVFIFLMYVTQAVILTIAGVLPLLAMRLSLTDLLQADAPAAAAQTPP
jgi:uncharacterized protein (TIRG00374 family)